MPFGQLLAGEGISAQVYFKRLEGIEASEGAFISCESPFKQMALVVNSKEGSEINLKIAVRDKKLNKKQKTFFNKQSFNGRVLKS